MKTENYIHPDDLMYLNMEWSYFLRNTPEQLGKTIAEGNFIFSQKVKKWCVKMSLKYNVSLSVIKERYAKD